jgi:gliding motility-associated-like protein
VRLSKPLIILCLLISASALPVRGQYDFTVSDAEGCTPMKVKYTFTSTASVDTITSYNWEFGNGQTSPLKEPDSVTYNNPGIYVPTLVIIFNHGGEQWISKPDFITVHHTVQANFNYYDSVSYNFYVFQQANPLDAGVDYTFSWNIEGFPPSTGQRQEVNFPAMDTFTVTLTVSDNFGCTSTVSKDVAVFEAISVQNVFTPNDDGFNDFFVITSNGGFPINIRIFSRTGILVYEAEGTTVTWDGSTASGQKLNPGIYFYAIEALQGDPNKRYSKAGVVYMYK